MKNVRAIIVTVDKKYVCYTLCVRVVALVSQHAMRMCHIVICGLSGSTIFFPKCIIKGTVGKKNIYWTKKCVL